MFACPRTATVALSSVLRCAFSHRSPTHCSALQVALMYNCPRTATVAATQDSVVSPRFCLPAWVARGTESDPGLEAQLDMQMRLACRNPSTLAALRSGAR